MFRRTLQQENDGADPAAGDLRRRLDSSWLDFKSALRPLSRLMDEEPLKGGKCEHVSGTCATGRLLRALADALQGGGGFPGLETLVGSSFFCRTDPETLLVKKAPLDYRQRFIAAWRPAQHALREIALAFSAFKTLPYREFLGNFISGWETGKKTLFVEEFSQTLARLFDRWREEAFPYLYLKMSDRFRNFLFDEFQDTSTLQFKALAPLIDEVLSREKNASLFIVGDRKQAIYRWRGGNSELMEESLLREQVPAIDNLCRGTFSATLDANWRSRREIVDFNNRFWEPAAISRIAAAGKLQQAIANNFQDSRQALPAGKERQGGYVELSLLAEAQRPGGEGEAVAEEEDGGSMGGRQLEEVRKIIDRLRGHGYEYPRHRHPGAQERPGARHRPPLGQGRHTHDLRPVPDAGCQLPGRRSHRLPQVPRLSPRQLEFPRFRQRRHFPQAGQRQIPRGDGGLRRGSFHRLPGAVLQAVPGEIPGTWKGLIEPFFQSVGFLPPYDLFSDITQVFAIYENFSDDTPFFLALGDALHRAERDGGNSIAGFLRLWEKMAEDERTPSVTIPENTPGVRVLTMHQSKGLEFPAVIVPVNDSGGRGDDSLHWDREGLFYINADLALAHPGLKERYENENNRSSIDLLNLLYVAFTRAGEALFVPVAVAREIKPPETATAARGGDGLVRKIYRASDVVGRHPLLNWFAEVPPEPYRCGKLEKRKEKQGEMGRNLPRPGGRPPSPPRKC